jgi:predicted metal-dependent HD superfamily phosphohydrolase
LKPEQVEMAIWFHDIINQPGAADNEQRSAEYFRKLIGDRADPAFVNAVVQLIMATTHQSAPVEHDQQFICDIDLASFGCPWECFMRDSSAVKAEFTGTEEEYYRGKKAFLQQMLNRPRIFLTDFFNERYEQQARENIVRLLELVATRAD